MELVSEKRRTHRVKWLTLMVDENMSYYRRELVTQCKHQIISGSDVTMELISHMLCQHWPKLKEVKKYNAGKHLQIYVVLPSTHFLVDHFVGDGLSNAVEKNRLPATFTDGLAYQISIKNFMKNILKGFKKISSRDKSFYPAEIKKWTDCIKSGYENIESFTADLEKDLVLIREYVDVDKRVKNVLSSMKEEGHAESDNESEERCKSPEILFDEEGSNASRPPLVKLLEILAQLMKSVGAPVVTLESDEESQGTESQKTQFTVARIVSRFILRRLIFEAFILRQGLGSSDPCIVYTSILLEDETFPVMMKHAIADIRRRKVLHKREQLEQLMSYLFQVRLFCSLL